MVFVVLNIVIALLLGFGAGQELVHGLLVRQAQPILAGLAGLVVSILFIWSGVARWRRWSSARNLLLVTAILSIVFHVYAALPPHRSVGVVALLIGAGYGLVLLVVTLSSTRWKAEPAVS